MNKQMEKRLQKLQEAFPEITGIKDGEEKGWGKGSILLGNAAEGGTIKGLPAADYYGEFNNGFPYVNELLKSKLKNMGYFTEWNDPGTLLAFPS